MVAFGPEDGNPYYGTSVPGVLVRSVRDAAAMLDVLAPVAKELANGSPSFDSVRKIASESAAATIPMIATKGRASFLGPRSIGHMDPGARSSALIVDAVADVMEGRA